MKVKDQARWEEIRKSNSSHPYGAGILRYLERWANIMELKIEGGAELKDIAKETSHEADTDGISGFMYGCAVGGLAEVWEHGEALRRWHNKETQIGTEGDEANDSGGVLNPALLCIGETKEGS